MKYFGKPWNPNIDATYECTATPAGHPCSWCEEEIVEGDQGFVIPHGSTLTFCEEKKVFDQLVPTFRPVHTDCFLREVLGSVGHLTKQCSCYGGTLEDPPTMSKRDAAKAAVLLYNQLRGS